MKAGNLVIREEAGSVQTLISVDLISSLIQVRSLITILGSRFSTFGAANLLGHELGLNS